MQSPRFGCLLCEADAMSEAASIFLAVIWRGIVVCLYASHSVSEVCLFRCTVCQGSSVEDFGTPSAYVP